MSCSAHVHHAAFFLNFHCRTHKQTQIEGIAETTPFFHIAFIHIVTKRTEVSLRNLTGILELFRFHECGIGIFQQGEHVGIDEFHVIISGRIVQGILLESDFEGIEIRDIAVGVHDIGHHQCLEYQCNSLHRRVVFLLRLMQHVFCIAGLRIKSEPDGSVHRLRNGIIVIHLGSHLGIVIDAVLHEFRQEVI